MRNGYRTSRLKRVEHTLDLEQQGMAQVKNFWAAFRTPRVILLAIQYFFWSIGVYGFVLWLPSIIKAGSNQKLRYHGLTFGHTLSPGGHFDAGCLLLF